MRPSRLALLLIAPVALGCAPKVELATDKPIELNLNIRIEQEVRIKLDHEVEELLRAERNPEAVRTRGEDLPLPNIEDSEEVKAAKREGQVGERYDGYLGVVSVESRGRSASVEVQNLVDRINLGRSEFYRRMAVQYAISVENVEAVAGVQRVRAAKSGEFVLMPDGKWRGTSG